MGESAVEPARLPLRPRLKPWYRLSTSQGRTVLRYGGSVLEFDGAAAARLLPHLLPLLDGSRTVDEITSQLGEPIRPAVERSLRLLAEQQLLVEPLPGELGEDAARTIDFVAASDVYGRDTNDVAAALAESRVAVVGAAQASDRIFELLAVSVPHTVRADWRDGAAHGCDLAVVAPSPTEIPLLPEWNRQALDRGTTWLQVLPFDGLIAAVGPVVVPRESPCYECYRLRRSGNISPVADIAVGGYPEAPALDSVLAGLAAVVALRRLALADGTSVGVLLAIEQPSTLSCSRHVLYRVPRCPACSPVQGRAAPSPWSGANRIAA